MVCAMEAITNKFTETIEKLSANKDPGQGKTEEPKEYAMDSFQTLSDTQNDKSRPYIRDEDPDNDRYNSEFDNWINCRQDTL